MEFTERDDTPILNIRCGDALVFKFIRPQARNPLSVSVLKLLHRTLDAVISNSEFKQIVFTGADDVFASGANLREIAEVRGERAAREFALRGQSLMNKIAAAPQETVAAVNGYCFGGALDLATACDRRIAAPNAVFCHPGVGLGIITGWSGTQRLPRLVGEAKALEMFLTAKQVGAEEALRCGLIDAIADDPLQSALANYAANRSS